MYYRSIVLGTYMYLRGLVVASCIGRLRRVTVVCSLLLRHWFEKIEYLLESLASPVRYSQCEAVINLRSDNVAYLPIVTCYV